MPRIWERLQYIKVESLAGLTVSFAMVPEVVAFAFVAGVSPLVALYTAFFVGLVSALLGGRPGMVSGAAGALAVVSVDLVSSHGMEYLILAVLLMGLIQILAGLLKLRKFIRLIPYPVMLGFVNGLALVIFFAQLKQFQVPDATGASHWLSGAPLYWMLGLVALTMGLIWGIPKLTRLLPASLAAILVVTALVQWAEIPTRTVGDIAAVAGDFPSLHWPQVPWTWETLRIVLPYALILAAVGLIESLMTMTLIDELTQTRGRGNRECLGQGVANLVGGVFGGMGGCAMIGQSMVNLSSGGRGRLSGVAEAFSLLAFILFASAVIESIPLAALVGVMFVVVLQTFAWSSFRILGKIPRHDALVLVLVSLVTLATDLAMGVGVGVVVSALVFAWQNAQRISARTEVQEDTKLYVLDGPLFFGSVQSFQDLFTPNQDPSEVVVDFGGTRVWDHSGVDAIHRLAGRYQANGKRLRLRHLSAECALLLDKAGIVVERDETRDPQYHVATDELA